jgi:hypothetical protein
LRRKSSILEHAERIEQARCLKSATDAESSPTRRLTRAKSRPKSSTLPDVGLSNPLMRLRNVVLPAPLGPMMPRKLPSVDLEADFGEDVHSPDPESQVPHVKREGSGTGTISHWGDFN